MHNPSQQLLDNDTADTSNFPPRIQISRDGEEGYHNIQNLQSVFNGADTKTAVNPPPNRTVFQEESPPPYRAYSVGQLDRSRMTGQRAKQGSKDCRKSSPCVPYSHHHHHQHNANNCNGSSVCSTGPPVHNNNNSVASSTWTAVQFDSVVHTPPNYSVVGVQPTHICVQRPPTAVVMQEQSHHYKSNRHCSSQNSPRAVRVFSDSASATSRSHSLNPRSARVFSDPTSGVSASGQHTAPLLKTSGAVTGGSTTSSNSGGAPPSYSDLSSEDMEVFGAS